MTIVMRHTRAFSEDGQTRETIRFSVRDAGGYVRWMRPADRQPEARQLAEDGGDVGTMLMSDAAHLDSDVRRAIRRRLISGRAGSPPLRRSLRQPLRG